MPGFKLFKEGKKYEYINDELGLTIQYKDKTEGEMDGFIIRVKYSQYSNSFYCKQIICSSNKYIENFYKRISRYNNRSISSQNTSNPEKYRGSYETFEMNEYQCAQVFNFNPQIELIGYKLLRTLNMCPKFILYESIDFKTYIAMN